MLALALAYPLLVHASILWPDPRIKWLALAVLCALPLYAGLRARRWWAWAALLAALAGSAALVAAGASQYLLYLPPVLIPLSLLVLFAGSLRQGREPLITRMARLARGALPADLERYTRRLTVLWSAIFAGLVLSGAALACFAPLPIWSIATNFIHYFLIGAVFVGEYLFRRWRFRHLPHPGFLAYVRLIAPRMRSP